MNGKLLQGFLSVLSIIADVLTIWHDDRALAVALAVVIAYFLYRLWVKKQKNKDKQ
ncbi:hypothetical protein ACE1CI_28575 [Aerosakkonemataceae cyanobacterium BLCC-F50]|uniref:Uncharacterized protein n=1 Tax=Floridaenema flaviceps BLCC-F50 TaxID=3153642 RepID=A0ABV4XYZ3_9CYAN